MLLATTAAATFLSAPAGAQGSEPASAQGSEQTSPQQESAPPAHSETTDIVVTAQKREQVLNRVGLTIAAFSEDALQERGIVSLDDLAQAVPALSFTETPGGTPVLSLRGVGYYETSLAAFPAVSLYLDEVPYAFPVLANHTNFDLQRVEVLKGPQGTLFGQNATGGAINFIAAKPTRTFEAGVTVGYGRFNEFVEEGYVSGPVSSTLSARLAQRVELGDGWQRSVTRPGDRNAGKENFMGRFLLDFHPSDTVNFLLTVNGWVDRTEPQAAQFIGTNEQNAGLLNPIVAATPFAPSEPRAADWNPGLPARDNSLWQVSLRGEVELGGDIALTSLTSYTRYYQDEANDFDGLPVSVVDYRGNDGEIRSVFQELRLANSGIDRLRWIVGANFDDHRVDQLFDYLYDASTTMAALGIGENIYGSNQDMQSYAVFGNTEFDITDQLTVKGGLRYTNSEVEIVSCGTDLLPPYALGNLFYGFLAGGLSGPYVPGLCFPINDLGREVNGVPPGQPGEFAGSLKEDNLSWRAGVDYTLEPGKLLYANVSKGYKTGNYPTTGASVFSQYNPVTQESVLAYEAGFKFSLVDRVVQVNGAAFYYDYRDKQLRSRTIDPLFGNLEVVQNIPESSVKGAELEVVVKPMAGLTITGAGTYLDATIDEFVGINAGGLQADFAGTPMPYTPKWQGSLNADHYFPLRESWGGFIGGTVSYRSDTVSIIGGDRNPPGALPRNKKLFGIDDYTLVDLRAGVENETWRVMLWGKNVFNTYYWNSVYPAFDVITRYAGRPATYGISVSYKYR